MPGKPYEKNFDKCPNCGSASRFVGELAKASKKRGIMPEAMNFYAKMEGGMVVDNKALPRLPIGSTIPAYTVCQDVCTECGTIYAVKIILGEVTKAMQPPIQLPQNRPGEHRGGMPPGFGN